MEERAIIEGVVFGSLNVSPLQYNHAIGQFSIPPYFIGKEGRIDSIGEDSNKQKVDALRKMASTWNDGNSGGRIGKLQNSAVTIPTTFPVRMRILDNGDYWTLPLEPLVSIKSKQVLIKRQVARHQTRGTIKESWALDDYQVNIAGIFVGKDDQTYPREDIARLREIVESRKSIQILCGLLELFNINQVVIEDWDIPFTKGKSWQTYTIKALSDEPKELLLKKDV